MSFRPLFRPTTVISMTGAPRSHVPPSRPPVRRYAHVFSRLMTRMTGFAIATSVGVKGRVAMVALSVPALELPIDREVADGVLFRPPFS